MLALLTATLLSPFYVEVAPEVRTSYVSLGRVTEDRPMQMTSVRVGYDTDAFGRIGIRHWNVNSLTDRRHDVHRHACYHTEFGPTWDFAINLADGWTLRNDLTTSWTLYDGFDKASSNRAYWWWQAEQSLENPFLTPFSRLRRCVRGNDYFYAKLGVRHRFALGYGLSLTPSVFAEGGNGRNFRRIFGDRDDGKMWSPGFSSVSYRLELGWKLNASATFFTYVEQYEVTGARARRANNRSSNRCTHNDWTHGGVGLRLKF